MTKAIYFDMDGTIANLYGVENWLNHLQARQTKPYREAAAMVDMRKLGKVLNMLQNNGYVIGIVSWLCKNSTQEYDVKVRETKINWLKRHIGAVDWNEIHIVEYGTPKETVVDFPFGILFDDETRNRENWLGQAFDVHNILEVLEELL